MGRNLLYKALTPALKRNYNWVWQLCIWNLENPIAFNGWERSEYTAFLNSIKGKSHEELTREEIDEMRHLSDVFIEKGIRVMTIGGLIFLFCAFKLLS